MITSKSKVYEYTYNALKNIPNMFSSHSFKWSHSAALSFHSPATAYKAIAERWTQWCTTNTLKFNTKYTLTNYSKKTQNILIFQNS